MIPTTHRIRGPGGILCIAIPFPKSSVGLLVFITSAHAVINQGACCLLCGRPIGIPGASVRSRASTYLSTAPHS